MPIKSTSIEPKPDPRIANKLATYARALAQWCLPYTCALCGCDSDKQRDLCSICEAVLDRLSNRCAVCALPLIEEDEPIVCRSCRESTPSFDRICGLFPYQPPLPSLITALKFNSQLAYARLLGELLAESAATHWCKNLPLPQVLIPVPLHDSRLRQRGYNQALELARPLARQLQLPIDAKACKRIKLTRPQSSLAATARKRNLRSAFTVNKNLPYQHVAIIDDVVTTGSTVIALSEALKANGVERVEIWCVCRA